MLAAVAALAVGLPGLAFAPASATAAVPRGPQGDAFYAPPASRVKGPAGTVVWRRKATGPVVLRDAARTDVIVYRTRGLDGRAIVASGTVAVPRGRAPRGGWPAVSFFHVTTGAADACAPSRATKENPEFERLTRADTIAGRLLREGIAVVRPDGEGIGTPGPHPYLIGRSLARSQADAMRAARWLDRRIARRWVAAGHSEGGVASLWSGALARGFAPELDLRAVAAFSPVSRIRQQLDLLRNVPVTGPGIDGLSSLASLIISGAGAADPAVRAALTTGALSPAAVAVLPHVEDRCLVELTRADSWGGLAPAEIPGPRFEEIRPAFYRVLDDNDVTGASLSSVPVRIDHGMLDAVAPFPLTEALVAEQRRSGAQITFGRWPTATHVDITGDGQAGPEAVAWIKARLR